MFTAGSSYRVWVVGMGSLIMKLVKTWRVVIEERELGEHRVKGLTRQITDRGDHWGEI